MILKRCSRKKIKNLRLAKARLKKQQGEKILQVYTPALRRTFFHFFPSLRHPLASQIKPIRSHYFKALTFVLFRPVISQINCISTPLDSMCLAISKFLASIPFSIPFFSPSSSPSSHPP